MRILVDCRYTRTDHHDGISRYGVELARELAARRPIELLVSDEAQLAHLPEVPWHLVPAPTSVREPFLARWINRLEPDVVYTPMQTMGAAGRRYAFVSTVHDLIYYSHPTPPRSLPAFVRVLWRLYHLAWWPQRLLLNRADAVVTVSETTKRLLIDKRLTKREIVVVPNATRLPEWSPRGQPTTRDLVYMGSFMPYKDVDTLARAMRHLSGWRLHLLSRVPAGERERLEGLAPAGSLEFHDGVSDEQYFELLRRATALVHASRDEGFGIPLVEAMGVGTPVVVSDIPIFREIGGDAARYFDVGDDEALAREVTALEREWTERSAASRVQAERFDWGRSAQILIETLERAAAARR